MSADTANLADATRRSGSLSSSSAGGSVSGSGNGGGILANAHEAPKRNASQSGFRSALKAAFVPPQPGKQMKTGKKPLGKTFHRTEPLPQTHEGGEILKVDPRGPNAPCGDGVVLNPSPNEDVDENGEAVTEGSSKDSVAASSQGGSSLNNDDLLSPNAAAHRDRSNTVSTQYSDASADSRNNPCRIKFAPLPTSGRLKRANSITIGVAARSQLLHSQGSGRNVNGNAQLWQQHQQQQQQQRQSRSSGGDGGSTQGASDNTSSSSSSGSRYSGIQPQQEQVDIGEEIRKSAMKAWDRVRRGSSASRTSENGTADATKAVKDEASDAAAAGEQTPRGAQTPVGQADSDDEQDGRRTPQKRGMQRRVSTGAFTGHASFSQIEERRKRGDREENDRDKKQNGRPLSRDDERENEATRFIEMLGSTGAGKEAFHGARAQQKRDGDKKVVDVLAVEKSNDAKGGRGKEDVEREDDEEERQAQQFADEALKGHSDRAMKAGGVEKMEKKRTSSLGLGRK